MTTVIDAKADEVQDGLQCASAELLQQWSRRTLHVSVNRQEWERNDPWMLTIYSEVAVVATEHVHRIFKRSHFSWKTSERRRTPIDFTSEYSFDLLGCIIRGEAGKPPFGDHSTGKLSRASMNWIINSMLRVNPRLLTINLTTRLGEIVAFAVHWIGPMLDHGVGSDLLLGGLPFGIRVLHHTMGRIDFSDFKTLVARCDDSELNALDYWGTPLMRNMLYHSMTPIVYDRSEILSLLLDAARGDGGLCLNDVDDKQLIPNAHVPKFIIDRYREFLSSGKMVAARSRVQAWQQSFKLELNTALLPVLKVKPIIKFVELYVLTNLRYNMGIAATCS
jgi:hypothetical protein